MPKKKKFHKGPKMPKVSKKQKVIADSIFSVLSKAGKKALNYKQISSQLDFTTKIQRQGVIEALGYLQREGRVIMVDQGKYKLKHTANFTQGVVDMTNSGNAYIVSADTESDVLVKAGNLLHALHGDKVKVLIYARTKGRRLEGEVVEIVERKRTTFVGTLEVGNSYAFLVPDSNKMQVDLYIPLEKTMDAKHGDKCVAKMTDWPANASSPFGEVIEVLGPPGDHDVEIHSILADFGLPYKFPDEVEAEAAKVDTRILDEEVAKRRDMREITTFTIDPHDAKDFDDALSIQKLENGNYEIGVHIADVSHYVQPGTLLDEEAIERATSVYLVDRVVPMLPEVLSNQVCSLRPNEEKYTFSAVFEMNENAEVKKRWFGRTVINSDRRFTYEEAQKIIEGEDGDLKEEILLMNRMAVAMREQRMQNGAISFDKVEVKFNLDEAANPTGVYFKESKDSNHLIEEFMLLANREVAAFIGLSPDGNPSEKTFVYRVHDDPDPTKLLDLSNFVRQFGYNVSTKGRKTISQSINAMLKEVKGKGEAHMIETLAVRSMSKAIYTTENIGHYGLAFPYYTHFTSPIRRYPDVMVHRLLQHYLDKGKSPKRDLYEEWCVHSSEREKMAASAERLSIKYMQVKYMEQYVGEEFWGVINGVTDWGIYVEITENMCEGMVKIRDLKDDYYVFDEKNYCIIGESTGKIYRLGDQVMIRIKNADLEKKQLDFELVKPPK